MQDVRVAMKIHRRRFLQTGAALLPLLDGWRLCAGPASQDLSLDASGNVFLAPDDPQQWPAFRAALAKWRAETKTRLNYKDDLYRRKEFAWSASNYSCCFLMTCDERFWDWRAGRYAVDAFLDEGEREFGGYDSVVLWHAYPRLGLDERNQFDFYRDLPGGLSGLRDAVRRFHRRGVRVYIDYNPWDVGTRRESASDLDVLVEMVSALEADGIFLDTMSKGRSGLPRQAGCRAAWGDPRRRRRGPAGEPIRSPCLVGAVVWRQQCPGRAAAQMVRAASHAAPNPALGPRSHRRAPLRLDEWQRDDGLGERIWLLGSLEPARSLDPSRDAADPAAIYRSVQRRSLDAAGAGQASRASLPPSGKAMACGSGPWSTGPARTSLERCSRCRPCPSITTLIWLLGRKSNRPSRAKASRCPAPLHPAASVVIFPDRPGLWGTAFRASCNGRRLWRPRETSTPQRLG